MMELLRILRDKGTLTQNEYELLVNASKADKERAEGIKSENTAPVVSKQLKKVKKAESWATKVKVKGDIRLRYQYQDTDGGNARSRGRYRARIGIIGKPVDNFEAGVGLVSGGSNQELLTTRLATLLRLRMLEWTTLIFNIRLEA